jgi:hypothetical protein
MIQGETSVLLSARRSFWGFSLDPDRRRSPILVYRVDALTGYYSSMKTFTFLRSIAPGVRLKMTRRRSCAGVPSLH